MCFFTCAIYRIDDRLGCCRGRLGGVRVARCQRRLVPDWRDVSPRCAGCRAQQRDGRAGQSQQHRAELPERVRRPTTQGNASIERSRFESRPRSVDVRLITM